MCVYFICNKHIFKTRSMRLQVPQRPWRPFTADKNIIAKLITLQISHCTESNNAF